LDPRELAKGLESLLPRRPKRKIKGARVGKARNVKSKATIVDSSDEEAKLVKGAEKSVTAKRKQPIKNTARKAKKVAGAGTGKVKEEEKNHASEDGEDEDEVRLL
jgi:hypothetical protein